VILSTQILLRCAAAISGERLFGALKPKEAKMENLGYAIWQKPYENALTELDPLKVAERVAAAETAIALRMKQTSGSSGGQDEQRALKRAREALNTLRSLKLPQARPVLT
jgi:hypothetical protein